MSDAIKIINVTTGNVAEAGIFCIKNKKAPGFKAKVDWFKSKINDGLRIKIAESLDEKGKKIQFGFIEYIPSELAWRPINAKDYYFIQCIALFGKGGRNQGIGSRLLKSVEQDGILDGKSGICTMSSDGPWMANQTLFEKNGFEVVEKLGRFELMVKKLKAEKPTPEFYNWEDNLSNYQGWHLVYSDQCPWHDKSVNDLQKAAESQDISLKITKLNTPNEAQKAPSGFATFSLIKDGKLLADHYISKTRFKNIVRQNQD